VDFQTDFALMLGGCWDLMNSSRSDMCWVEGGFNYATGSSYLKVGHSEFLVARGICEGLK
jgi:hypothetical protein